VSVKILYSQACGYRCRAASLAAGLEKELGVKVEMEPGTSDQFDVLVDDHLVASKDHPGFLQWMLGASGFPEESAAIAAVKAKLASG
jgi:predicted Rdx family selenoprotein